MMVIRMDSHRSLQCIGHNDDDYDVDADDVVGDHDLVGKEHPRCHPREDHDEERQQLEKTTVSYQMQLGIAIKVNIIYVINLKPSSKNAGTLGVRHIPGGKSSLDNHLGVINRYYIRYY